MQNWNIVSNFGEKFSMKNEFFIEKKIFISSNGEISNFIQLNKEFSVQSIPTNPSYLKS